MPLSLTPAMEQLIDALDALTAEEPLDHCDGTLLNNGEGLITSKNRIDYLLTRYLNAMWTKESTVSQCGRTIKSWLVDEQHLGSGDAGARIAVARDLLRHEPTAKALSEGAISQDHARVLTQAIPKFPSDEQDFVEQALLDAARHCDPAALGRACKDLADHLGLNGDAERRHAQLYGSRYLRTSSTIDGMVKLDAMLEPATAAAFNTTKVRATPVRRPARGPAAAAR